MPLIFIETIAESAPQRLSKSSVVESIYVSYSLDTYTLVGIVLL